MQEETPDPIPAEPGDTAPNGPARFSLVGHAVVAGVRVLGLGDTPMGAWEEARAGRGGAIPTGAVLLPITAAARARVWDWGDAVADLLECNGILCTVEEAAAITAACSSGSVPPDV